MQAQDEAPDGPDLRALPAQMVLRQVRDHAIFLIDLHGRLASWNEGVGRILGWDEADWLGQPAQVAFTDEDVAAGVPDAELRLALETGRAGDDRWMQRRNGDRFFAAGAVARLSNEAGVAVGYLKVLRDFTAFRQAEEDRARMGAERAVSHARAERHAAALTAAIDATAEGVFIGDRGGLARCNGAARLMLGLSETDALPRDPADLIARHRLRREPDGPTLEPADLPFVRALAGVASAIELWATRPDGEHYCFRSSAAPIVLDGMVVGAVAVHSDLTERLRLRQTGSDLTQVETVLRERDQELRALVGGIRDYAIYTVAPDGRISSWHDGAMLMKGYTALEAIGMPFENLFVPDDRARGRPAHEMAMAARDGEYKGEGMRLRKDGSTFDAAVVLTALHGPQGELLGFLKLTQDITVRRRHERQLEDTLRDAHRARADAERASHSKGEFLATISHELRTPLSAIIGWANLLERRTGDPEVLAQGLATILRNARVQVQLIEDLLDMNRIETGQLRLDLQAVDLGGVVASAVDSALPNAAAKGIGLRSHIDASVGVVLGDPGRLQQVVGNLLSNAIKFTAEGGHIEVALDRDGARARICVSDDGQGIEPAFLARVFDRFQQQDASTTRRHGGLGIGLAVVRHLVQLHGGEVRADSAGTGRGARFTVHLPLQGVSAGVPAPATPAPSPGDPIESEGLSRLDGIEVLLVEDEPDVRAMTERMLRDAGAQVVAVGSADEGMAALARRRPQVILSDIGMPVQDGYDFLRRVRSLPAAAGGAIPAAAFTAYARPEDRARALAAGFQLHLSKPVLPATLVEAVLGLTGQRGR